MRRALNLVLALVEILFRPGIPRWKVLTAKVSRLGGRRYLARWFFTELSPSAWTLLTTRDGPLKIAVTREGTVGDKIGLAPFLEGVRRRFPGAKIIAFDWDINAKYYEVFRGSNLIDELALSAHEIVGDLLELSLRNGYVDLAMENRYVVKTTPGHDSRAPAEYLAETAAAFREYDTGFANFPRNLNGLAKRFPNRANYDLMAATARVAVDPSRPHLNLAESDFALKKAISRPRYVTIHHGAGPTAWGERNGQTKMWFAPRWAEVVTHLNARGIEVVQLGLPHEEKLEGANTTLIGRTDLHQSGAILKDALFHLDTEGGLVHAANAVGTKSLVLFGPTPTQFFGYARNVNLKRGTCHDCWWTTDEWQTKCPAGYPRPACMEAIAVDDVIREVDRLLDER